MIEPKSSFPVFTVEYLDAAKSFYADHFGFIVVFSSDWYIHLVSSFGVQVGSCCQTNLLSRQYFKSPMLVKA